MLRDVLTHRSRHACMHGYTRPAEELEHAKTPCHTLLSVSYTILFFSFSLVRGCVLIHVCTFSGMNARAKSAHGIWVFFSRADLRAPGTTLNIFLIHNVKQETFLEIHVSIKPSTIHHGYMI